MKCFLMFMVVYWIFSWYYSGIEKEIEEIDKDHMIWQNDVKFKEFLEEQKKVYADDMEYEKRKEIYVKNYNITRH